MRDAVALSACVGVGVGFGYALARFVVSSQVAASSQDALPSPSHDAPPPSWGWGWFCDTPSFSRVAPSTIIVHEGKVPVKSKGPLLWLATPPAEVVAKVAAADAHVVPSGDGAFAVDCRVKSQQLDELLLPYILTGSATHV